MYTTMHGITTSDISFANKGFIKNGITYNHTWYYSQIENKN